LIHFYKRLILLKSESWSFSKDGKLVARFTESGSELSHPAF